MLPRILSGRQALQSWAIWGRTGWLRGPCWCHSCHPSPAPPLHPTSIPPLAPSLLSHASTPCFTPVPAQGAARELHLVPLLSHLLVSPTASQMWAASWGRGHQLEASPAGRSRRRGARPRAGKPAKKAWPWLSHPAQLLLSGRMGSAPPGPLPSPPPRCWVMCMLTSLPVSQHLRDGWPGPHDPVGHHWRRQQPRACFWR